MTDALRETEVIVDERVPTYVGAVLWRENGVPYVLVHPLVADMCCVETITRLLMDDWAAEEAQKWAAEHRAQGRFTATQRRAAG